MVRMVCWHFCSEGDGLFLLGREIADDERMAGGFGRHEAAFGQVPYG